MSADLVPLPCEPADDTVIERLEEVLAKARDGKVSSVAIAVVYRDGSTGDCWSKIPSRATLIGAVGVLHARLTALVTKG